MEFNTPKIIAPKEAIPVEIPIISPVVNAFLSSLFGTKISEPVFTTGKLLKNRNFLVLRTAPLA